MVEDELGALSYFDQFAAAARVQVEAARHHGDIAAAQRLWSLASAAAREVGCGDHPADREEVAAILGRFAGRMRRQIVEATRPRDATAPPPPGPLRRFILCLDFLPPSNRFGSHLHQVCCHAAALASLPDTEAILVISTAESWPILNGLAERYSSFEGDFRDGWRRALAQVAPPEWAAKIAFYTPFMRSGAAPITQAVNAAVRFRPHAILYFLGVLRSVLMPEILRDVVPQVAVQLSVLNAEPEHCDLVLSHAPEVDFSRKPTPEIWAAHVVPIIPLASEDDGGAAPPPPATAFRLVTTLAHGRIERTLLANPELADRVVRLLRDIPDAGWMFIGLERPEDLLSQFPEWREMTEVGRIVLAGHTPRLREVYRECHLYVHLPGLGGGGMGVAMAMAEGLPALVEAGTDCDPGWTKASYCANSASFSVESAVYRSSDEAFRLAAELANDDRARRSLAANQSAALAANHSIAAVANRLQEVLPWAARRFSARRSMAGDCEGGDGGAPPGCG